MTKVTGIVLLFLFYLLLLLLDNQSVLLPPEDEFDEYVTWPSNTTSDLEFSVLGVVPKQPIGC